MNSRPTAVGRALIVALYMTVLVGAEVYAQDLAATGLKAGDRAEVTTNAGTVSGRIRDVSTFAIALDHTTVPVDQVLKIDRLGDGVWEGTALGVALGATLGATVPRRGCTTGKTFKCYGGPAAIMGLLGAWIDYKRVGRTTVFERSKGGIRPPAPVFGVGQDEWFIGASVRVGR